MGSSTHLNSMFPKRTDKKMKKTERKVFYARNMTELFYHIKTIADLKIVGGCTDIKTVPAYSLSALLVPELR